MARYFSPQGLEYNPPTLDEMLKPLEIYREAYDKLEQKIEAQQLNAQNYASLIDPQKDANAYNLFKTYNDALDASAQAIMNNAGYNEVRQKYVDASRQYKGIIPVIQAYTAREEDKKKASALEQKGYITDYDPYATTLDDYMNGNRPQINSVKMNDLFNLGMRDTKTYSAKQIKSYQIPGNKTRTITGITTDEFDSWVSGQTKDENLTSIYNSIVSQYPYFANNSQFQYAILNGMRAGCDGKAYDTNNPKPKDTNTVVSGNGLGRVEESGNDKASVSSSSTNSSMPVDVN